MAKKTESAASPDEPSRDLVVLSPDDYPALAPGANVGQLLAESLAGQKLSAGDLTRIKVPSGGGTLWTVPGVSGPRAADCIEGVIVHAASRRAYWSSPNPSGQPPDCASVDMQHGVGEPGGDCDSCPLNEFGTSRKPDGSTGRGKACKETVLLFVLSRGVVLPDVVAVSPASLKPVRQYFLQLVNQQQVPYWGVLTRLRLVEAVNRDGTKYAQVRPEFAGVLGDEDRARARSYAAGLASLFASAVPRREEVEGGEESFG